jgi:hypothetical protein
MGGHLSKTPREGGEDPPWAMTIGADSNSGAEYKIPARGVQNGYVRVAEQGEELYSAFARDVATLHAEGVPTFVFDTEQGTTDLAVHSLESHVQSVREEAVYCFTGPMIPSISVLDCAPDIETAAGHQQSLDNRAAELVEMASALLEHEDKSSIPLSRVQAAARGILEVIMDDRFVEADPERESTTCAKGSDMQQLAECYLNPHECEWEPANYAMTEAQWSRRILRNHLGSMDDLRLLLYTVFDRLYRFDSDYVLSRFFENVSPSFSIQEAIDEQATVLVDLSSFNKTVQRVLMTLFLSRLYHASPRGETKSSDHRPENSPTILIPSLNCGINYDYISRIAELQSRRPLGIGVGVHSAHEWRELDLSGPTISSSRISLAASDGVMNGPGDPRIQEEPSDITPTNDAFRWEINNPMNQMLYIDDNETPVKDADEDKGTINPENRLEHSTDIKDDYDDFVAEAVQRAQRVAFE